MDDSFLDIYEDELAFLREMGAEFAEAHPKIAGRLKLDDTDVRDPYVERLMEGFAFLSARVRLRMQAQYPNFTQNLLSLLYPNYTAPVPACTVFEFSPKTTDSALTTGFTLPIGTSVSGRIEGEDTPVEFTLCREITLRPLIVDSADYTERPADLERLFSENVAIGLSSAIRVRVRVAGGATLGGLDLLDLGFFVSGESGRADRILRAILMESPHVVVRPVQKAGSEELPDRIPGSPLPPIKHDGFSESQSLLPVSARTFSGHRILQEAFIIPEAFRFIRVQGLGDVFEGRGERAFDLVFGLDSSIPEFSDWIDAGTFRLHCGPAVNLFERRADRISVQSTQNEHLVTVDSTRPQNFEVYSVKNVDGIRRGKGGGGQQRVRFQSVFQPDVSTDNDKINPAKLKGRPQGGEASALGSFNIRRDSRIISTKSSTTSYYGTDVYLRLMQPGGGPITMDIDQLVITTLCTNRGLALRLGNKSKYTLRATAPVKKIRAIIGPTLPRVPLSHGSAGWDLINALSLNHLSFSGDAVENGVWLRRLLSLFVDTTDVVQRQLVSAFEGLSTDIVTRRLPGKGPVSYGRGLEISLHVDEQRMRGTGPFLLASALERFMSRAATLNTYTQTVLLSKEGEELARWPVRMGGRHVL